MKKDVLTWLVESHEPWTRYRTLVDLLGLPQSDCEVVRARRELLAHPRVQHLLAHTRTWERRPMAGPDDPAHPLHLLSALATFGLNAQDAGLQATLELLMRHQGADGAFEALMWVPPATAPHTPSPTRWDATVCTAAIALRTVLVMGVAQDARVRRAITQLLRSSYHEGTTCHCGGNGSKVPASCLMAHVSELETLAELPGLASRQAITGLLDRVLDMAVAKLTAEAPNAFDALRFPYVEADLLHVVDALSRFPAAVTQPRFGALLDALTRHADAEGRYRATACLPGWRGWSFGQDRKPSPWITFLALRAEARTSSLRAPEPRPSGHTGIRHELYVPP